MNTKRVSFCGCIACMYTVLTVLFGQWSYGPVQLRLSELLCLLCYFNPCAVWGVSLGCLLANLFSPVSPLDLLFGTAATLLGCLAASRIRKPWLFPLPIILTNGGFIGAEMALTLAPESGFPAALLLYSGNVILGETAVLYLLGVPLLYLLRKTAIVEKCAEL